MDESDYLPDGPDPHPEHDIPDSEKIAALIAIIFIFICVILSDGATPWGMGY